MSQWHVRTGDGNGNSYQVVFHLPVPSVLNRVSVNYQTALINSGLGGKTILPDGDGTSGTISAAEKASIQAGSIYEHTETYLTNPGNALATDKAALDARYSTLSNTSGPVLGPLQKQLTYYGATSTV